MTNILDELLGDVDIARPKKVRDTYEDLPECMQACITRSEWAWTADKTGLMRQELEPDDMGD